MQSLRQIVKRTTMSKKCLLRHCLAANREMYFAYFESRILWSGEDIAADSNFSGEVSKAMFTKQFVRGLPKEKNMKLLKDDSTSDPDRIFFLYRGREPWVTWQIVRHAIAVRDMDHCQTVSNNSDVREGPNRNEVGMAAPLNIQVEGSELLIQLLYPTR